MLVHHLFASLLCLVPAVAFAQGQVGNINELVGYVNTLQSSVFDPGDTLTGTHRASLDTNEPDLERLYWVRARFQDTTSWVDDWVVLGGGEQAELSAVASQFGVPLVEPSPLYSYEVELKCDDPFLTEILLDSNFASFTMGG